MTRLVLNDPLLDFQVLRAAGSAPYGGADIGECLATAHRVESGDLDSWHAEWVATAETCAALATQAEDSGDRDTARLAYLRPSTYFRTAGIVLLRPPLDPRLHETNAKQTDMFRRAGALMDHPPEVLEIPYEQVSLPGYFFRSAPDAAPRATVILTGGYDSTVEELYLTNAAAALARGYNVLAFDGPGQGGALIQQHLTLRPDWENVIKPVLDYALTRPDVDPHRIAPIGPSLGAHLAPRAASEEHRLAACIADCGAFDLHAAFLGRLPGPLAASVKRGSRAGERALRALLGLLITKPVIRLRSPPRPTRTRPRGPTRLRRIIARLHPRRASRSNHLPDLGSAAPKATRSASPHPNCSPLSSARRNTSASPQPKAPATTAKPEHAPSTTHGRSTGSTSASNHTPPRRTIPHRRPTDDVPLTRSRNLSVRSNAQITDAAHGHSRAEARLTAAAGAVQAPPLTAFASRARPTVAHLLLTLRAAPAR